MDQSLAYCHIGASAPIWKRPQPFVTDKESLPSFPTDCLPSVVCEFVKAAAIATSTDEAMAATAVLSAFSGCIAGAYRAVGKPGHSEPLTLYTLIAAEPGERKSPIMRYVREELRVSVELLIEHGYIKEDSRRVSGQKTRTVYLVNPYLFENGVPNVPEP